MSAPQEDPMCSDKDRDDSLDTPSSSNIPTETIDDSKALPDCSIEKKNYVFIDEKGDHAVTVEETKNIVERVTSIDKDNENVTKNISEDSKNTLEDNIIMLNDGESVSNVGERDKASNISENKTSEDDQEEMKLRYEDDDDDEEQELDDQGANKDETTTIADKSLESSTINSGNQVCAHDSQKKTIEITESKQNKINVSDISEHKQNDLNNLAAPENTKTKGNMSPKSLESDIQFNISDQVANSTTEVDNQGLLKNSDILSSTVTDSFLDNSIKKIEHGLTKPDMMLEIPTQEFVEFSDEDSENLDGTDESCKTHSQSSIEDKIEDFNISSEKCIPIMDSSDIIDVDNSEIMLKCNDTDQLLIKTRDVTEGNISNIETDAIIDVDMESQSANSDDMESSSVNSEIMLKYDDSDQPLGETGDIDKRNVSDMDTSGVDVDMESSSINSDIMLKCDVADQPLGENEDIRKSENKDESKVFEREPVSSEISQDLDLVLKVSEDMDVDTTTTDKLKQDLQDSDEHKSKVSHLKLGENANIPIEEIEISGHPKIDLCQSPKIKNIDDDVNNSTDEIEILDDENTNLNHPLQTENLNLKSAQASCSAVKEINKIDDETLKDTITKLDEDITNLTDEIEILDDLSHPSKYNHPTDVGNDLVDTIITNLDDDIENLTDDVDNRVINVDQQSEGTDLNVKLAEEVEKIDDKVLKDTITKLDEDINNLTNEIEIPEDLDQPSGAKDLNLELAPPLIDNKLKDTITKLDEDIKNLTDEICDNIDTTLDQSLPKETKLSNTYESQNKNLKDTITKLDEDIKNLTDEIEESNELKMQSKESSKPAVCQNKNLKDTITNLDEDIKNLTDEIEQSSELNMGSKESSKPADINLDLAQPSTSYARDIPGTSRDDNQMEPQPSTLASSEQLAPDTKDEVPEVTDSLGLLAESSRVMDDDEEADEDDDGDDDDDFDNDDESSNQMTAEHSEDSNAQHSEPDAKDQDTPTAVKEEFNFAAGKVSSDATEGDKQAKEVQSKEIENKLEEKPALDSTSAECDIANASKSAEKGESEKPAAEVETVKLSDTSDTEVEADSTKNLSILKSLLGTEVKTKSKSDTEDSESSSDPQKTAVEGQADILNIVDLDESSSEGDIQEVRKPSEDLGQDMDVISVVDSKPDTHYKKEGSEVPIKTTSTVEPTPEVAASATEAIEKSKFDLEVFNLDSDEEDTPNVSKHTSSPPKSMTALEMDKARECNKCINFSCDSGYGATYTIADPATVAYYDAGRKRRAVVCMKCLDVVIGRTQNLMKGIKDLTPLLNLEMKMSSDLVEISDSESEEEVEADSEPSERIGEIGAKFLEEQLADMINETWRKYKLDTRLKDAQDEINKEIETLEEERLKIEALFNECQVTTDKIRNELYGTFEPDRKELPAVSIVESNGCVYVIPERCDSTSEIETRAKRRMSAAALQQPPAKRPAIPLGYAPLSQDAQDSKSMDSSKLDDDKDISVVKLSMESAPPDLPPTGEISRPPLRVGMAVYAMRNTFCSWLKVRITEVHPKNNNPSVAFTMCRVKFERVKVSSRVLPARCLAYAEPADVRLTIGTRVIALFKEATPDTNQPKESFYSGIVSEIPNPVNKFRYLIFFDDGYAQYVKHCDTRVVCESASLVWEEVHPFSREFVRNYLMTYPERPMVRLHAGQSLKTEWNGKWWVSRVIQVDASLVQVHFEEDNRTEWIYRGSTRLAPLFLELQAAERQRTRPMPRSNQRRRNMPYVEYTRSDEQSKDSTQQQTTQAQQVHNEEMRRQRAVAKKSTVPPMNQPPPPPTHPVSNLDSVTSRVVYYTPKNAVKPHKMTPHVCSPKCKRSDVLALKDLRTYNPLAKPLLSGWERQVVRFKGHKEVMYRAPCGRRVRNMRELHRYLQTVQSDMPVDLFDFHPNTHCLAEFVLNKCLVGKKDLSHGKENVPVPCVNYYDESLPEFCSYNTERTPTAGVPLNLDPDFLCGCDCQDDCEDKTKCACWKMTLEGARTIGFEGTNVGYEYKRLPEPLPSGIYECNSRCKCKQTCLNRVAQHPLQLKLQVFKTYNRGWGIRALNDVPKGSFLCVYAGNLLTDATANLDGLNEGDEYLAELDYIEVVEQMKEGYEEDIPDEDKILDKKGKKASDDDELSSSEEEGDNAKDDDRTDDDFRPGFIGMGLTDFDKRLRKREKERKNKTAKKKGKEGDEKKDSLDEDGCITISDDEEVREPSSFMAQTDMGGNFVSKYKSVRSYFGRDEACYIMDAKVQGNIGRYLNHSCTPNVFVQNVFVDTHDPRFPWVAFFALSHIRAGTELTWNYNYDIGSVPGKVLYCYCGAPNCRGRLL